MHKFSAIVFFILFNSIVKAQVYVVNDDIVYYYNEIIEGADAATFDLIYDSKSQKFARDMNAIYYLGKKTAYDANTFTIHPEWGDYPEYISDKNDIYIKDRDIGFVAMGVSSIASFSFINKDIAIDDSTIYWQYQPVIGSDAKTFSRIDGDFYKDKNQVYYEGHRLPIATKSIQLIKAPEGDIEFIGDNQTLCDDNGYCYQMNTTNLKYINYNYVKDSLRVLSRKVYLKADPSTFEVPNSDMEHYARDKNVQFYLTDAFPDAVAAKHLKDDESFRAYYELVKEELQRAFAANSVTIKKEAESSLKTIYTFPNSNDTKIEKGDFIYMNGIVQSFIDADTFEIFNTDYAKDKNNVYLIYEYEEEVSFNPIAAADATTFAIIKNPYTAYSKDAKRVYKGLEIVENADPNTFQIRTDQHAEDKNSVFLLDQKLKSVKPQKNAVLEDLKGHYYSYGNTIFYKLDSYEKLVQNVTKSNLKTINAYYAIANGGLFYKGMFVAGLAKGEVIATEDNHTIVTSKRKSFSYGQPILKNKKPLLRIYRNTKYTTDGTSLFYEGTPIVGVNLTQIHHSNEHKQYITFTNGMALYGDKLIAVDLDSFEEYKWLYYAKDKNHVYFSGEKTQYDTKTFYKYDGGFTSDKNGVYFRNKLIPEADSETFNVFYRYGFDTNNFYYADKVIPRTAVHLKK